MGNSLNLDYFLAMWLQAQNYVLTHILVWNMLIQLIVVGCLYMLARLAAEAVRPWLRRQLARHPLIGTLFAAPDQGDHHQITQPHLRRRFPLVRPE